MDGIGEYHVKWGYPGSEGQKAACSPSYADYRPKTNAVILWDMSRTNGRQCKEG
jgi:hypothetical protein